MKVEVICVKDSRRKSFLKGNTYKGVTFDPKHFRVIGEDKKSHIMKIDRFILVSKK